MVVTLGQQYHVGEKPTVILYQVLLIGPKDRILESDSFPEKAPSHGIEIGPISKISNSEIRSEDGHPVFIEMENSHN